MAVSPGLETAQNNNEKIRATSAVLKKKSSVVGALCKAGVKHFTVSISLPMLNASWLQCFNFLP
jgi:hypothetical protein